MNTIAAPALVWYVSYGSNMCAARMSCYLSGGTAHGSCGSTPGALDPTPAQASAGVWLPGQVYFAGHSALWGGAPAFYDPTRPGPSPARAYLVTAAQFADVLAQENGHAPTGTALDLATALTTGQSRVNPGRYGVLHRVGDRDGYPMLTFTAPWTLEQADLAAPSPAYMATLVAGLAQGHGWDTATAAAHLGALPGAR